MAGSLPLIRPMLATLGALPEAPGWGYEFKWDDHIGDAGVRPCRLVIDGGGDCGWDHVRLLEEAWRPAGPGGI